MVKLSTGIYTVEHDKQIYVFSSEEKAELFFKLKKRYPNFIFNLLVKHYRLA